MNQNVLNIYEKMLAITSELTTVEKNLEVGTGKSSYKAVGEADVLAAVRPLEKQYKVYSYPVQREIIESSVIENEGVDYNTKQKVIKKNLFLRVKTIYRFVNIEKPEEYIDIVSYGDGVDSQDKAPGKAMTYSDKYALMKAYKIMTGDDPDQNESEGLKGKTTNKPSPQPQNKANYASYQPVQASSPAPGQNASSFGKLNAEQALTIYSLSDELKAFACQKFGLSKIEDINTNQAEYVITTLREKGIIK